MRWLGREGLPPGPAFSSPRLTRSARPRHAAVATGNRGSGGYVPDANIDCEKLSRSAVTYDIPTSHVRYHAKFRARCGGRRGWRARRYPLSSARPSVRSVRPVAKLCGRYTATCLQCTLASLISNRLTACSARYKNGWAGREFPPGPAGVLLTDSTRRSHPRTSTT
jgi:hypothetical protein